jgi:hypothetical protein
MGDLNETLLGAQRLATAWPGAFEVLSNEGAQPTVRRDSGRTVDHICFFANGLLLPGASMRPPVVLGDWDIARIINHRRKAFRRLRRAKADPLAHNVEITALHTAHAVAAKQAIQATKMF